MRVRRHQHALLSANGEGQEDMLCGVCDGKARCVKWCAGHTHTVKMSPRTQMSMSSVKSVKERHIKPAEGKKKARSPAQEGIEGTSVDARPPHTHAHHYGGKRAALNMQRWAGQAGAQVAASKVQWQAETSTSSWGTPPLSGSQA